MKKIYYWMTLGVTSILFTPPTYAEVTPISECVIEEHYDSFSQCFRGVTSHANVQSTEQILVFMSFSVPRQTWLQLSENLEEVGGTFVMRGLPNNSFQDFLCEVMELRKLGINAPIEIDPEGFEMYNVTATPTFVLVKDGNLKKMVGNVTVSYALEKMGRSRGPSAANPVLFKMD